MAFLASEWALRFGGDEGLEEVLRRRENDYDLDWTTGRTRQAGEWIFEEWKLATRVFIQQAPGMLKIS